MSYVTSVTIVADFASPTFEERVTEPYLFRDDGSSLPDAFRRISTDGAGGSKVHSHDVFAAGLNYCDRERLRAWADSLPWLEWGIVAVDTEGDHPELWVYGALASALRSTGDKE